MIMREKVFKKVRIISVACVLYAAAAVAIYYSVDKSIDDEVNKLKDLALENLDYFFKDKPMYVDLLYGMNEFNYKKTDIPQVEEPTTSKVNDAWEQLLESGKDVSYEEAYKQALINVNKSWIETYGDVTQLYELDIFPNEFRQNTKYGWALKIVQRMHHSTFEMNGCVETYLIFPKQVGYKNYSQVNSVETAVKDALDFEIKHENSELQPYYERGSTYNLISKMESLINNKYYYLSKDSLPRRYWAEDYSAPYDENYTTIWGSAVAPYYKVIIYHTQPTTYSIKFVGNDVVQRDKYTRMAIYIGILTIIMAGVITFIVRKK